MSSDYQGKDPLEIAKEAERDLNSYHMKQGQANTSDSVLESGVDEAAAERFPGGSVTIGSAASGAGNNRDIPPEEGGDYDAKGRLSKAGDFEGEGGPEDKAAKYAEENPGADDVRKNIRNQGDASEGRDRV